MKFIVFIYILINCAFGDEIISKTENNKEYIYNVKVELKVGDLDNTVSLREGSSKIAKQLCIEDLGTYVTSSQNIQTLNSNTLISNDSQLLQLGVAKSSLQKENKNVNTYTSYFEVKIDKKSKKIITDDIQRLNKMLTSKIVLSQEDLNKINNIDMSGVPDIQEEKNYIKKKRIAEADYTISLRNDYLNSLKPTIVFDKTERTGYNNECIDYYFKINVNQDPIKIKEYSESLDFTNDSFLRPGGGFIVIHTILYPLTLLTRDDMILTYNNTHEDKGISAFIKWEKSYIPDGYKQRANTNKLNRVVKHNIVIKVKSNNEVYVALPLIDDQYWVEHKDRIFVLRVNTVKSTSNVTELLQSLRLEIEVEK